MKQILKKFIFLSVLLFVLPACYFNTGGISNVFNLASVGADFAPADSELLYIDLDVDAYESNDSTVPYYEISTSEEYGDSISRDSPSNCEIEYIPPEEEDSNQERDWTETLLCIVDVPEYEFVVKDFHLVYNFPPGVCEYTSVGLPWHFNYPIQPGPVVAECSTGGDPNDPKDTGEQGVCDVGPGGNPLAEKPRCRSACISDEDNLCPGRVKCCYGGSKQDGERWEPKLECFGGPALIVEGGEFDPEQFYKNVLQEIPEDGLRNTITLKNLVEINGAEAIGFLNDGTAAGYAGSSFPYANYLKVLDISPEDLTSINRNNDVPGFLQVSAVYNHVPRLFFDFSCLDSAGEVLHKILLMIREWNTFEEFYQFYNTGGADEGDPDVEGIEGEDCQYEDRATLSGEFAQCNDLLDFDNTINCNEDLYPGWCLRWATGFDNIFPRISYGSAEEEN